MKYVIGVDLGGTNLKIGGVSPHGELLFRTDMP
ncbi:MAG: ROK family protein [Deltaproteobacteria bacterium]|nr:ROK family protein [Deltaproteobacteria bacterium]